MSTTSANLAKRTGRFAAIAFIEGNHFVCIYDIGGAHAFFADPPELRKIPLVTLKTFWSGEALLLAKEPIASEESLEADTHHWAVARNLGLAFAAGAMGLLIWRQTRRKLLQPIASGIFVLLQGCEVKPQEVPQALPELSLSAEVIDLGAIIAGSGQSATTTVELRNLGVGVLRLNGISSSCGCTIADRISDKIEPHSAVALPVKVSLGTQPGPRSSRLKILSNDDPERPVQQVEIRWQVEYAVTVKPDLLDFGAVKPNSVVKQLVRYQINRPKGTASPVFKTGSTALTLDFDTRGAMDGTGLLDPARSGSFLATLDTRYGAEAGTTSFTVDYANDPTLMIPVRWNIVDDYSVAPASEFFSGVSPDEVIVRKYWLRSADGHPFRLSSIGAESIAQSFVFDPAQNSSSHLLTITYEAPHLSGVRRTAVQVKTDDKVDSIITIPVTIVVR